MLSFRNANISHGLAVQQSDDSDGSSDSDGDSYTEDGSESGDEQYGVPPIVKR
jgi:hypothetical protein